MLSDDVGQIYFLNTGQGDSQKDAKYDQVFKYINTSCPPFCCLCLYLNKFIYDAFLLILLQFFLGDYRPLVRDTQGNVLDQVSTNHYATVFLLDHF